MKPTLVDPRREAIISRAIAQRDEILQMFATADHWNREVRKPEEEPIDIDKDGALREMLGLLERFIDEARKRFNGPLPAVQLVPDRARPAGPEGEQK